MWEKIANFLGDERRSFNFNILLQFAAIGFISALFVNAIVSMVIGDAQWQWSQSSRANIALAVMGLCFAFSGFWCWKFPWRNQ